MRRTLLPSKEPEYVCERKFSGPDRALGQVMSVLESRCAPDAEFREGVVNSIYFDTPRFSAYAEKANGDTLKTKVRLRWYGRDAEIPPAATAFIEVKERIGSARRKLRTETQAPRDLLLEAPLDGGALEDFLLSRLRDAEIPTPLQWRPVCRISYSRRRFFDMASLSRISLDWDIRAERVNRSLFPAAEEPLRLDRTVCEFKNRLGEPPAWAEEMLLAGLPLGSFSKYGEIMSRLLGD